MTKPNFTSINVLIDASGSMGDLTNDTIGGFNQFLKDQKQVPGEAIFSLCLFNTRPNPLYTCLPLAEVPELNNTTYRPSGGTSLLDAVGVTINSLGAQLSAMPEEGRPSKVIFLIITDGEENSSKEFALDKIKEMVSHQRDVYSWEFVFMGANIDAFAAGSGVGVIRANSLNYVATPAGTRDLYKSVSRNLSTYRSNVGGGSKVDFFNQDDQQPVVVVPTVPVDVVINPAPTAPVISPPPGTPVAFNPPIDFTKK